MRVFTASGGHFVRKLCLLGLAQRQMSLYLAQSHASCCDPFDDAVLHLIFWIARILHVIAKLKHARRGGAFI